MPTVVQDVSGDNALQAAIAALKAKIEAAEESEDISQSKEELKENLSDISGYTAIHPTEIIEGKFVYRNGATASSEIWVCTPYIEIDFADDLGLEITGSFNGYGGCCIFDADKNPIIGVDGNNVADYGGTNKGELQTITVKPVVGARYIRISARTGLYSTLTDIGVGGYTIAGLVKRVNTLNDADKEIEARMKEELNMSYTVYTDLVNGTFDGSGSLTNSSNKIRPKNFIPLKKGEQIYIDFGTFINSVGYWKTSVSIDNLIRNDGGENTPVVGHSELFTAPEDGYFMIAFRKNNSEAFLPSDFDGEIRLITPQIGKLNNEVADLKKMSVNIFPSSVNYNHYINGAIGTTVTAFSSNYFVVSLFDIKPSTRYVLQTQGRVSTTKYFGFADSNNKIIGYGEYTVAQNGDIINVEVTTPDNAASIFINSTDGKAGGHSSQYVYVKELLLDQDSEEESEIASEQIRFVAAAQKTFVNTPNDNYADNRLPTFVHVTDVHGDSVRFGNAVKIAQEIHADAILNTGDNVAYYPTDDVSFLAEKMENTTFPMLPLIGNHESYTYTEQQMYERFIQPFSTDLVLDSSVDYPTYYYRDFQAHKFRVIGINQFQYRGVSNMTTQRHYHQAQIDFLCNALITAPDDYGIIIMLHTPEASTVKTAEYSKFYQDEILYNNTGASIKPIYEIVDAYISGTTLNKTYDNFSGNTPATFTVNADFSTKHDSEFIAYVSGHMHRDAVYYLTGVTNKQLMLNVVCTNAWSHRNTDGSAGSNYPYYCELTDLPRVIGAETENAVNVYTIDRVRKTVRIVRIGSDTPYNFDERRDYMVIPYAE